MQTKLALHGIDSRVIEDSIATAQVQTFRAERVEFSGAPFEGCQRATFVGQGRDESQPIAAGSLLVPVEQRLARLILALLEPQAPDSLAAWGLFNACFEQKEQMERYVAEQIETSAANYFICSLTFGDMTLDEALRTVELMAHEVMPAFA